MININDFRVEMFKISDEKTFEDFALKVFEYQSRENLVYKNYLNYLKINPERIDSINKIPFLPVTLFKTQNVVTGDFIPDLVFKSSGTTGETNRSVHFVRDSGIYIRSFMESFKLFYGDIRNYCLLTLLPSYFENKNSSLIFMINYLINESQNSNSGFYHNNVSGLYDRLAMPESGNIRTILFGASSALIKFAKKFPLDLKNTIVMETGGMKGMTEEITRTEFHDLLKKNFGITSVHSEYGMTELLSQAYSKENGLYFTPPWMKILIRDVNDPFSFNSNGQTGGINIIDLANIHSCSFIETQDLGRCYDNDGFEVLGRIDNSDLRGCNLLVS